MPNTHETLTSLFSDIADSIRAKTGDSNQIVADDFPDAIDAIPTGGGGTTVTSLSVTQNGTYTAPTGTAYSPVTVDVQIPDTDPVWAKRTDIVVGDAYTDWKYEYFPNTDTVAYKDIFLRITVPSGLSWSDWPSIKLCKHEYAEGSFPSGYTPPSMDVFTVNTKATAASNETYCTLFSKAQGSARVSINGFDFTNVDAYTNLRLCNNSTNDPTKAWFHIVGTQNNFVNCLAHKKLPAGAVIEVYAARPVSTTMPLV